MNIINKCIDIDQFKATIIDDSVYFGEKTTKESKDYQVLTVEPMEKYNIQFFNIYIWW